MQRRALRPRIRRGRSSADRHPRGAVRGRWASVRRCRCSRGHFDHADKHLQEAFTLLLGVYRCGAVLQRACSALSQRAGERHVALAGASRSELHVNVASVHQQLAHVAEGRRRLADAEDHLQVWSTAVCCAGRPAVGCSAAHTS